MAGHTRQVWLRSSKRQQRSIVRQSHNYDAARTLCVLPSLSYQRLYFRNANHPILRPSVTTRRQDRANVNVHIRNFEGGDDRKLVSRAPEAHNHVSYCTRRNSHIFDGKTVSKETAAFQLCDIVDPMLKDMIEDPDALRETCDVRELCVALMDC